MPNPQVSLASGTNVGRMRSTNQDCALAVTSGDGEFALIVVCDGIGGMESGEVASSAVIEHVSGAIAAPSSGRWEALLAAVQAANTSIVRSAGPHRMGATMVAIAIENGQFSVAYVGDSRAYLVRQRVATPLTVDHSWVMERVELGLMTLEQAEQDPRRNIITRAVGTDAELEISTRESEDVQNGDLLLVCSDGLHGVLADDEIAAIATRGDDADAVVQLLISRANEHGGPDNIGVAVGTVGGGS
ncbi:MAG TPA: protein phosphatase 2C domain-containing protein [Dehalococcoidia bacterium]|nr:protein phosphatase 2C domain-containing protein [Dehalococcoidia bacterium]